MGLGSRIGSPKESGNCFPELEQTSAVIMDNAGLFENTGRTSCGPQHPSIFELLAQDQLRDLLQPAVRYVLNVSHTRSLH